MSLALSLDGGDTWRHVRDIEPGGTNDVVPRGDEGVAPGLLGGGEGNGGGGGFTIFGKRRRLLADKKKDFSTSKSSSSSSYKSTKRSPNKKNVPQKKRTSSQKKKPAARSAPARRRRAPAYAPVPASSSAVTPDETGGWYDNPAVLVAKDGKIHVAYGGWSVGAGGEERRDRGARLHSCIRQWHDACLRECGVYTLALAFIKDNAFFWEGMEGKSSFGTSVALYKS